MRMQTHIKFLNFHVSLPKNFLNIFSLPLDEFLRDNTLIVTHTYKIHA